MNEGNYKDWKKEFGAMNVARKKGDLKSSGFNVFPLEYFADGRYKMNNEKVHDSLSIHNISQLEKDGGLSAEDQKFLDKLRIEAIHDVSIVREIFDVRCKINAGIDLSDSENKLVEKFGMPNLSSIADDQEKAAQEADVKTEESASRAEFLGILGQRAKILEDATGPQSILDELVAAHNAEASPGRSELLSVLNSRTEALEEIASRSRESNLAELVARSVEEPSSTHDANVELAYAAAIQNGRILGRIRREKAELDEARAKLIEIEIRLGEWEDEVDEKLAELAKREHMLQVDSIKLGDRSDALDEKTRELNEKKRELDSLKNTLLQLKSELKDQSEALDAKDEEIAKKESAYKLTATFAIANAEKDAKAIRENAKKDIAAMEAAMIAEAQAEIAEMKAEAERAVVADGQKIIDEAIIAARLEAGLILKDANQKKAELDLRIDSLKNFIASLKRREEKVRAREAAVEEKIAEASQILRDLISERDELEGLKSAFDLDGDGASEIEVEEVEVVEVEFDETMDLSTDDNNPDNLGFDEFSVTNGASTFDEHFDDSDYDVLGDLFDLSSNGVQLETGVDAAKSGLRYLPDVENLISSPHKGSKGLRYKPDEDSGPRTRSDLINLSDLPYEDSGPHTESDLRRLRSLDELSAQVNRLADMKNKPKSKPEPIKHGFHREPTKVVPKLAKQRVSSTPTPQAPVKAVIDSDLTPDSPLPRVLPTEEELLAALSRNKNS